MLRPPNGPVRVMHPLSTAVFATAPRAYYTYPPPFLQEEQGLRLCVRIILCGVEFSKLGTNPNYESDSEAWTERRHELWSLLGYSEDEIHRMEIEEAQALLGNDSSSGDSYSGGYNDGSTSIQTSPGVCRACYGSGKCHNCGGDGLYQNMFTGEQIACPNCTNGVCWKCDGTGLDS